MDLHTITAVALARERSDLAMWRPGDAYLAGGTWLFCEPQPELDRLIDLTSLGWPPCVVGPKGLGIAATCTVAEFQRLQLPADWIAAPLIGECCRAFLASFKVLNAATVGGNLCLALPAGPMIALAVALDASCVIWAPAGNERRCPASAFVRGPRETALAPGEVLRAVDIPAEALHRRTAFRRISLTPHGRSGCLVIGTRVPGGGFALTVTAATRRPVQMSWTKGPSAGDLRAGIDAAIPDALYHDDVHGMPDWRRHMTCELAEAIRRELADEPLG